MGNQRGSKENTELVDLRGYNDALLRGGLTAWEELAEAGAKGIGATLNDEVVGVRWCQILQLTCHLNWSDTTTEATLQLLQHVRIGAAQITAGGDEQLLKRWKGGIKSGPSHSSTTHKLLGRPRTDTFSQTCPTNGADFSETL